MQSERVAAVVGTINFTSPRIIVVIMVDFHREAVYLRKNPRRLSLSISSANASPSGRPSLRSLRLSSSCDRLKKKVGGKETDGLKKKEYDSKKIIRSDKK